MYLLGVFGTNEIILLGIIILFCLVALTLLILFLLNQYNTLLAIQPQNRFMSPGEVWLQLIPLFNLVWQFVVVIKIANSIQKELSSEPLFSFDQPQPDYAYQGYNNSADRPTFGIGMAFCVLSCCSWVPLIGTVLSLAGMVCWIIYWVQLAECKRKIRAKQYTANYNQSPF